MYSKNGGEREVGEYDHNRHKQLMVGEDVKTALDGLQKDIIRIYNVPPDHVKDVTYGRVIKCLLHIPATSIRGRASGAQEIVSQIIFNGTFSQPESQVVANAR